MEAQSKFNAQISEDFKDIRSAVDRLTTLVSENEEEDESLSQSTATLEGQFRIEASSHVEQVEITTLRCDSIVDDHVEEPEIIDVQEEDDETQSNNENIYKSPESPTSTPVRHESIIAYIPRSPYPQGLIESTRKEDRLHEHKEIILTKNVASLSLVNVHKFLFPLDHIVLNTQLVTNLICQIPTILGRPFFATSKAIIQCRSG